MPPSRLGLDAIYDAELARLARMLVDVRANKASRMFVVPLVLIALRPTPERTILLLSATVGLAVLSRRDRRLNALAAVEQGLAPAAFVARGGAVMAAFHMVILLTTGALGSPLLPIPMLFTLVVSALVGDHPARASFLLAQALNVLVLSVATATGLSARLAPAWLAVEFAPAHTATVTVLTLAIVLSAAAFGRRVRRFFDAVIARVGEARQDLLETHQAQAEELTALTGAIAHELKNPLASIKGLATLVSRDVPDGKPAERVGVLRREIDRMQGILEEFLTYSRPLIPLAQVPLDLRALCLDVAALHEGIARDRGVRLVVAGDGSACADPRKTRQVLINLVQNALDASRQGGTVSLSVHAGVPMEVRVEDEGDGLDPTVAARVFEAGVTSRAKGNGLGLTIARALARQQGGDLALADRAPRGCRATLTLPSAVPEKHEAAS